MGLGRPDYSRCYSPRYTKATLYLLQTPDSIDPTGHPRTKHGVRYRVRAKTGATPMTLAFRGPGWLVWLHSPPGLRGRSRFSVFPSGRITCLAHATGPQATRERPPPPPHAPSVLAQASSNTASVIQRLKLSLSMNCLNSSASSLMSAVMTRVSTLPCSMRALS